MRIRYPFAGAFVVLLLLSAYLGFSSIQLPQVNVQVLHFAAFFVITLTFYWIFDSTRRRILNLTLFVITLFLGVGAEAAQGFVIDRPYDPLHIAANILGSLIAIGLCSIYHKRMLDRRRKAKGYGIVPQEGDDLELGTQETGVVEADGAENTLPSNGTVGGDNLEGTK